MATEAHFPPIGDYAIVGDCRTAALISREGALEWLCFPDFHSPSIFARLLDREKGGHLSIASDKLKPATRRYRGATNILETEIEVAGGRLRITDFMPVVQQDASGLQPERELIRIVEACEGTPRFEVRFAPRPNYGAASPALHNRRPLGWTVEDRQGLYLLRSDFALAPSGDGEASAQLSLHAGERRILSFSYAGRDPAVIPALGEEAERKLEQSAAWWRNWVSACTYEGPYREAVTRSVLTLKLLQFSLSGAVVAAATTSLPEAPGHRRNWDYRYCWLRDAAFTLRAFTRTGFLDEGASFFGWLMHATQLTQPRLQALYNVYGKTKLPERKLDHLCGYRNSRPVRAGNAAHGQTQNDVYGAVVSAATGFVESGLELGNSEERLLVRFGETVRKLWRQPDEGIWEFRNGKKHNTWSKVMCWLVLSDLLKLDSAGFLSVPRESFERECGKIRKSILEEHYDRELGSFVGAKGESYMDATLLLLPICGFIEPDDPRMEGTWRRIEERLQEGCLIRRYEGGTDEMSGREGTFAICGFWAVNYLARCGRVEEAKERMNALLAYTNDLGLLSEEIDAASGEMLGNFPQAFSHTGIINAALAIERAERQEAAR